MRKIKLIHQSLLTILILIASAGVVHAQRSTIKGIVKDETGPLANASGLINILMC